MINMPSFESIQNKISNHLSSFVSDNIPQTEKKKCGKMSSKPHHASKVEFQSRLQSFEDKVWILSEMSPLQCAQSGWNCYSTDMLHCPSCKAFLCTTLPSLSDREKYKFALELLHKNLSEGHEKWCGWRVKKCPLDFILPPPVLSVHYLQELRNTVGQFISLGAKLPYFDSTMIIKSMGIDKEDLKILTKGQQLDDISTTACVLALCGWSMNENFKQSFGCNICLRKIGLWLFYSIEEKDVYLRKKTVEKCCTDTKVRNEGRKIRRIQRSKRIEEKRIEKEKKRKEAERILEESLADVESSSDEEMIELPSSQNEDDTCKTQTNSVNTEVASADVTSTEQPIPESEYQEQKCDISMGNFEELLPLTNVVVCDSNMPNTYEANDENVTSQDDGITISSVLTSNGGDEDDMWMAALGYTKENPGDGGSGNDIYENMEPFESAPEHLCDLDHHIKEDNQNVQDQHVMQQSGNEEEVLHVLSSDEEDVSPQKSNLDASIECIKDGESTDEESMPSDEEIPSEEYDSEDEDNAVYNGKAISDEEKPQSDEEKPQSDEELLASDEERVEYENILSDDERYSEDETRIVNEETLYSDDCDTLSEGDRGNSSGEDTEQYNPDSPPIETISSDDEEPVSSEQRSTSKFQTQKETLSETSQEQTVSSSDIPQIDGHIYIPQLDGPSDVFGNREEQQFDNVANQNPTSGEPGEPNSNNVHISQNSINDVNVQSANNGIPSESQTNVVSCNTDQGENAGDSIQNSNVSVKDNVSNTSHSVMNGNENDMKNSDILSSFESDPLQSRKRKLSVDDVDSNKRVCFDSEDDEPAVSEDEVVEEVQYDKEVFDPLQDHCHWCGWITTVNDEYGAVKAYQIIPVQLQSFLSSLEEAQCLTETDKYATNVDGICAVRDILSNSVSDNFY